MAQPTIQPSFASGEWAPKLRSRVDIQKYRTGAQVMRNFFVDWAGGGASTRQGTRFLAQVGASGARLIPFQASTSVSYVLEFGQNYIRFYSNGAQVMSGGNPYQITSPFLASDLFPNQATGNPGIKFVQDVNSLIICHPSYQPQILTLVSPTNWTINSINFGATIGTPTGLAVVTNLGTLANGWNYGYTVTAVDINGQESIAPAVVSIANFETINNTSSPGTITVSWNAVSGAQSYNVYKASPTFNVAITGTTPVGFVGNTTTTEFTDTTPGVAPDFSQSPPIGENPFFGAPIASFTITTAGSYTTVPTVTIGAPPAGGQQATASVSLGVTVAAINSHGAGNIDINVNHGSPNPVNSLLIFNNGVILQITATTFQGSSGGRDMYEINSVSISAPGSIVSGSTPSNPRTPTGSNAVGFSFFGAINFNFTWGVNALFLIQPGSYLTAPAVTFSAGSAAATAVLGTAGSNPGVPSFIQERLTLAGQLTNIQGFNLSQPDSFFNFNTSFPAEDDDAISGSIVSEELNDIRSMVPVPTGILALTGKAGWLIGGGAGISTMNPITPANVTAQPQAFNGANDMRPIKANMDVLYGTNKGNYIRDLSYNIYAQIFTGSDLTTLSNHLFFGFSTADWGWAEEPFKTVWIVRSDGMLLSLAYVKDQELIGWARHDTNGQFKSVCTVIETTGSGNTVDAVYVIVERTINGSIVQYVERMADRYFNLGYIDSWSVDCGLQTAPNAQPVSALSFTGDTSAIGNSVTLNDTIDAPFTSGMVGWRVDTRNGGVYQITAFTSTSQVSASVVRVPNTYNEYTNVAFNQPGGQWSIWQPVTSVSGLTQLVGQSVVGTADGTAIGPLTVSGGGSVTLPFAASKVTLGLAFTPQLQSLPLDLGEPTVQGKRKKIVALTLRVADTLGLSAGKTFQTLVPMKDFTLGNVPTTSSGVSVVTDLVSADGRTIIDQEWDEAGNYCIQQNLPYPATILGIMPEVVVGDTPK